MAGRWQYQIRAEPLLPLAAPETVTLDKWFRQPPEPVRRARRPTDAPSSFFVYVPPPPAVPLMTTWYRSIEQPYPARRVLVRTGNVVLVDFSVPIPPTPVPSGPLLLVGF